MAYDVVILPSAHEELDSEIAYLTARSKKAATRLLKDYREKLESLASSIVSFPLSRMPELAARGFHTALLGDYLFLYYIEDNTLVVAHFFHQRQDYASLVVGELSEEAYRAMAAAEAKELGLAADDSKSFSNASDAMAWLDED